MNRDDEDLPQRRVGVVGEGINDVEAFRAADVSFAVAEGTSYARNNASMILQTNDFDSCMRAVMWGRNIYMNVQRFLQFQITCCLTVLIVVIVSFITMTESVLNPVQLIWINLIMDILGALALASTRPTTDIAKYQAGQGNIMTP
ncbi:MAG: HAD hydrolase family protein [Deltaproteobacteria bacterium]|nr:HAD hydrolase family protein [Deltaproteobacteria bacterium]